MQDSFLTDLQQLSYDNIYSLLTASHTFLHHYWLPYTFWQGLITRVIEKTTEILRA